MPPAVAMFGAALLDRHHALSFRQPEFLRAIARALQRGETGRVRLTLAGAAQDTIYEVSVSPVPQGVLCAFEDRSAWEQMDQMRRDFVANVSHELRTPLTALLGFIETLRGPARNDAPARERFLAIMASEAERMNRLVRDLLHLSRVEAEERVLPGDEVDIAGLLRTSVASLRPVAETAACHDPGRGCRSAADHPRRCRSDDASADQPCRERGEIRQPGGGRGPRRAEPGKRPARPAVAAFGQPIRARASTRSTSPA